MTAAGAKSRRRRIWKYLLYSGAGVRYCACRDGVVRDHGFIPGHGAPPHGRRVGEVTGGRAELGSIHTSPFRLRVEVRDLTIHGREAASEVPYAHVARVVAEIKIISILGAEFGFHSLILDHPVIHFIVYPDGTTNQPAPKSEASGKTPVGQLFSLSISRLEVRGGEVLWNDRKIPVDFTVNDVSADMQLFAAAPAVHQQSSVGENRDQMAGLPTLRVDAGSAFQSSVRMGLKSTP